MCSAAISTENCTGSFLLSYEFIEVTDIMVIQYLGRVGIEEQSYQIIYYSFTTVHTVLELSGIQVSQHMFSLDFLLETNHPKVVSVHHL